MSRGRLILASAALSIFRPAKAAFPMILSARAAVACPFRGIKAAGAFPIFRLAKVAFPMILPARAAFPMILRARAAEACPIRGTREAQAEANSGRSGAFPVPEKLKTLSQVRRDTLHIVCHRLMALTARSHNGEPMAFFDYSSHRILRVGVLTAFSAVCFGSVAQLACSGTAVIDPGTDGGVSTGTSTDTGSTTSSTNTTSTSSTSSSNNTFTNTGTNIYTGTGTNCTWEPTKCAQSCCALWWCIQTNPWLCEGLFDIDLYEFYYAPDGGGCIPSCEDNPALLSIVDPANCESTINTLKVAHAEFNQACEN